MFQDSKKGPFFLHRQCQQVNCPIESKEKNRQSMQIATLRGESIRCLVAGAEKARTGLEKGRGPCREMVQSRADHLLGDHALLPIFCLPETSIHGLPLNAPPHFLLSRCCAAASFLQC